MFSRFLALLAVLSCSLSACLAQAGSEQSPSPPASAKAENLATTPHADSLTQEEIKALIREVAEKDIENDKRQRDYSFVQRDEEHRLNGKGDTTSTESKTY